jgi:hypothetical protein
MRALRAAVLAVAAMAATARAEEKPADPAVTVERICALIADHADLNALPRDFLARLIWKESRFDPDAVSPAGAEGIAQFMPGTAALRGLEDSFDVEQAIPASAHYLGELRTRFGNLGLAAAAYNSGEARVTRWLGSGGFLPIETENYVLDIMGEPVESFSARDYAGTVHPLSPAKPFERSCRELPVTRVATIPMARVSLKPWGVQVAGSFRRSAAIRQYERLRGRFAALFAGHEAAVSRVRSPRGRAGVYAVRIGADSRPDAEIICQRLRAAGGACVVMRNR